MNIKNTTIRQIKVTGGKSNHVLHRRTGTSLKILLQLNSNPLKNAIFPARFAC